MPEKKKSSKKQSVEKKRAETPKERGKTDCYGCETGRA